MKSQGSFILYVIIALMNLCANELNGQTSAFVRTYGDEEYEDGKQIIECNAGGYLIVGTTGNDQTTNTNFYVLKLNENFDCVWNRTLGGYNVENGISVLEDFDGSILLCGYTNSYGAGGYDAVVYKLDIGGEVIWQNTYGGDDWDFGSRIVSHPNSGYLMCGKTYSFGNGDSDAYLVHISTDGQIVNEWSYGTLAEDSFDDIIIDGQYIYVAGNSNSSGSESFFIYKIDLDGYIINSYFSADGLHINSIAMLNSDLYAAGYGLVNGNKRSYFMSLHKDDLSYYFANLILENGNFEFTDLVADSTLILVGNTDAFGLGGYDMLAQQWSIYGAFDAGVTFGSIGFDQGNCVIRNQMGNLIFLGSIATTLQSKELMLVYWSASSLNQNYNVETIDNSCVSIDVPQSETTKPSRVILNHASGSLLFDEFELVNSIVIHSTTGQFIYSQSSLQNNSLKLPDLASGIYVVRFRKGVNEFFWRFVI